ncbi:phage portal protein [Curtobacterium sp. A7_M15]|uniref:phage portal protein n=1 Tax=Curtobacterium sp. A7_M15 TaxID=3065241 RepID=UPI002737CC66|nr:phage portal protein [Curtobacterium sp. A7_M15]MDP4333558.1 phage portal protein [Curtobacterium sp. A7_M15]
MSIRDAFRLMNTQPTITGIASPFTETQLSSIVLGDIFENVEFPLTRAEAMRVPAVAQARNLLAPTIGRQPLKVLDKRGLLTNQPAWTYRTDQDLISVQWMLTMVVDDLIFYGRALLGVKRGSDGFPLSIERIGPDRFTITDGVVLVDEKPVDARSVIYIPGLVDPLLDVGSQKIREAADIERGVAVKAAIPNPSIVFKQKDESAPLDQEEVQTLMEDTARNRRSRNGTITFLPPGLDMEVLGGQETDFSLQARNAVRIDIGSYVGIPSSLMNATTVQASLTYENKSGERDRFYVEALPMYTAPIEARLSLDDVVPQGQRVRFDLSELYAQLPTPTGAPTED